MQPSLDTGFQPRPFYVAISGLAVLIAVVGFWPSYIGPLLAGSVDRPPIIHLHAAVYAGWLCIFVAQSTFAAARRLDWHVALGNVGIGYGVLVILVGLAAAFGMFAIRVQAGDIEAAQTRLAAPFLDMVAFTPLFTAAVHYRRKPEIHKRLMIVATTLLLVAAVGRIPLGNRLLTMSVWWSPVLLAMVYDGIRLRRVHPVYVVGLAILLARGLSAPIVQETTAWHTATAWLAGWLT
jgi:hypothetical protein